MPPKILHLKCTAPRAIFLLEAFMNISPGLLKLNPTPLYSPIWFTDSPVPDKRLKSLYTTISQADETFGFNFKAIFLALKLKPKRLSFRLYLSHCIRSITNIFADSGFLIPLLTYSKYQKVWDNTIISSSICRFRLKSA